MFKPIEGFEDYSISEDGMVMNSRGMILKCYDNGNGYRILRLCKDGEKTYKYIHRLVAQAFIPNPNNFPEVDHINQVRDDNTTENLRWITHSGNGRNRGGFGKCLKGVFKQGNKYRANISIDNKQIHIGMFDTEEQAHKAYLTKYNELMEVF